VLALQYHDVDFSTNRITWRAEVDKRRKTWRTPLPAKLAPALRSRVDATHVDGGPYFFPHPSDGTRPMTKDHADTLLERAYRVGGITRTGGLWHPLRRHWAMARKGLPLADLAAAGGRDDVRTLLMCYQLADPETVRAVVDHGDGRTTFRSLLTPKSHTFRNNSHTKGHRATITRAAPHSNHLSCPYL
jgi:integrase